MTAEELLLEQDWDWNYTDSPRAYQKGEHSWSLLVAALLALPRAEAVRLWTRYAPKGFPSPLD